ncbi:polysaccharide pyruvyl transferase family protein [Vibrio fluvialis]|nr:polysaccharide pyruvyl transferase family protein [Vibrio fluvialis]
MKQVSIVTFHKAHNYGAVLQAYALRKQVEALGCIVDFYDYSPEWLVDKYSLHKSIKKHPLNFVMRKYIAHLLDYKRRKNRYFGFERFIAEFLPIRKIKSNSSEVDHLILGSDQIWNPSITKGFDSKCFGLIPELSAKNIVSYAASMENIDRNEQEILDFTKLLKNIDHVSVREDSLKEFVIEQSGNKNVTQVLDPTLLIDKNEWYEIAKEIPFEENYLLVYENYIDKNTNMIAKQIAEKLKLKILTITPSASWQHPKDYLSGVCPLEYLGLFKNAKFVLTTSYHGLAFSINFNIPFLSLKVKNGVNRRADSLLSLLNLEDYLVDSNKFDFNNYHQIDFEKLNTRLIDERAKSIKFLQKSLGCEIA